MADTMPQWQQTDTGTSRRPQRQFSEEFRAQAVRLVLEDGKSVGAVAREQDLTASALRQWVERARADRTGGKTGLTTSVASTPSSTGALAEDVLQAGGHDDPDALRIRRVANGLRIGGLGRRRSCRPGAARTPPGSRGRCGRGHPDPSRRSRTTPAAGRRVDDTDQRGRRRARQTRGSRRISSRHDSAEVAVAARHCKVLAAT